MATRVAGDENDQTTDETGEHDDSEAEMATQVYQSGTDDEPMETMLGPGVTEDDVEVEGEMATVVRPVTRLMYELLHIDPDTGQPIESWMLERSRSYTMGRSSRCDIHIAGETISGTHARIEVATDGKAYLTDEGSRNGTFLNDTEISAPARVAAGDRIQLTRKGAAHLELRSLSQQQP